MTVRAHIGGLTFVLLASLFQSGAARAADEPGKAVRRPPNVVVILADDLGFSDLGCYGGEIRTPNLDGLAAGGLRFTQFYNTARCWPSRAALLTGYYAQQVRRDTVPGVPSGGAGTRPKWARLLPEMLRPLGYRSYHSGKWHVDGMPLANGFDHSYYVRGRRPLLPSRGCTSRTTAGCRRSSRGPATTRRPPSPITAIKYLKEHAEQHAGQPFFLYLAFTAPHFPLQAPPEDIARYRERYRAGWEAVRAERWQRIQELGLVGRPPVGRRARGRAALRLPGRPEDARPRRGQPAVPWDELTDEQRAFQATKMALHAAMVDRMDREIGRVLDQIRAMGAFENTLIVFLSDNGASAEIMVRDDGHDPSAPPGSAATHLCLGPGWSTVANTPFRRHKTWVHEGGIATPLIVHWPRGIAARGELRHDPGHVIDLVPTILEVAGRAGSRPGTASPSPRRPGRASSRPSPATARCVTTTSGGSTKGTGPIRVGRLEARRRREGRTVGAVRPRDRPHRDAQPRAGASREGPGTGTALAATPGRVRRARHARPETRAGGPTRSGRSRS